MATITERKLPKGRAIVRAVQAANVGYEFRGKPTLSMELTGESAVYRVNLTQADIDELIRKYHTYHREFNADHE